MRTASVFALLSFRNKCEKERKKPGSANSSAQLQACTFLSKLHPAHLRHSSFIRSILRRKIVLVFISFIAQEILQARKNSSRPIRIHANMAAAAGSSDQQVPTFKLVLGECFSRQVYFSRLSLAFAALEDRWWSQGRHVCAA